ncbi:MAG: hypothetical protein WD250_11390 [Egibacteraceae bacterium]
MATVTKAVVATEIGPMELEAGVAYIHDLELDDDVALEVGQRVEIRDGGGKLRAATVTNRIAPRWRLSIEP